VGLKLVERKDTDTKPCDSYHPLSSFFFDQVEGKVPCYNPIELHLGKIDVKAGKWQGMGKGGTKFGSQIQRHTTRFLPQKPVLLYHQSLIQPETTLMASSMAEKHNGLLITPPGSLSVEKLRD
jgi:hypothetical protein